MARSNRERARAQFSSLLDTLNMHYSPSTDAQSSPKEGATGYTLHEVGIGKSILKAGVRELRHQGWIRSICRDGRNREAETQLYEEYQPWLVRIATSYVTLTHAEDLVQDVFAKILNCAKLAPFAEQSEAALRKWLSRCTRNECISFVRRPANNMASLAEQEGQVVDRPSADEDSLDDRKRVFVECRESLTPRQHRVIELTLAGEDNTAIVSLMDINKNSIYKLRNAAMNALRKCVEGKLS